MSLRYKRPGDRLDVKDYNDLVDELNRLRITVAPPLEKNEGEGGITIWLTDGGKVKSVGTA